MACAIPEEIGGSRPTANFPPSVWGHSFASFSFPESEYLSLTEKVEKLKGEVKKMLLVVDSTDEELVQKIELINLLSRLGVSYHFETEIENQLQISFNSLPHFHQHINHHFDLNTTALLFRVFRQQGCKIPSEVFRKFTDGNEKFLADVVTDVRGILSLYEATFLSFPGEDILDEALSFTKGNLKSVLNSDSISPRLKEHINHALLRPFWKCVPRIAAREYIYFYQGKEEEESPNEILLRLAKLDFNRVQLLHRRELAKLSRWWAKELKAMEGLPHVRDRIVEGYVWANVVHFEPQYDICRTIFTKSIMMMSILDDTYDAYGTFDELQRFSLAFQREAIDEAPDYMKIIFNAILDLSKESETVVTKQGGSRGGYYMKESFKELVKGYKVETEWLRNGACECVPRLEDYVSNGLVTSAYRGMLTSTFIGRAGVAGIREHEWLLTNPNFIRAGKLIGRLMNDKSGSEVEQKRKHIPSAVECCMKEYGMSKQEAIEEVERMIANAWKEMNMESMNPTPVLRSLLLHYLNLMRVTFFTYEDVDKYTQPIYMKEHVTSMFINPIPM